MLINLIYKVFRRLQRLHLCTSHKTTLNTLHYPGKDFDATVKQWKSEMMDKTIASSHIQVCEKIPSPISRYALRVILISVEYGCESEWNR